MANTYGGHDETKDRTKTMMDRFRTTLLHSLIADHDSTCINFIPLHPYTPYTSYTYNISFFKSTLLLIGAYRSYLKFLTMEDASLLNPQQPYVKNYFA
jgi:hypothetical protein